MHGSTPRRIRGRARATLVVAVGLGLFLSPGVAQGVAPVLTSVDLPLYQNHPTFHWSLPTGTKGAVTSVAVETATSAEVGTEPLNDGYFLQRNVQNNVPLAPSATSYTDLHGYTPGTYFVHVEGHDPDYTCTSGTCFPWTFSNIMSFDVVKPPPVGGSGGGGTVDKLAPLQTLSFSAVQRIGRLRVTTRTSEAGTVSAGGTVAVPGSSRVYRLKGTSKSVAANVKTTLLLKLSKKSLKAVRRALKKHKRVKAKVTVTATDAAKNTRSAKIVIVLRN
jgi:hypothetical protein